MKIIASVSVEIIVSDTELLDEAQARAIDALIDSVDDIIYFAIQREFAQ